MRTLRTPLAKVKGHGSAKEGTGHFWSQRLTAIAMVPLVFWLCFSLAALPGMSYVELRDWLSSPVTAVIMILLLIAGFFHARLGLQVIIEDYVGSDATRTVSIIAVTLLSAVIAIIGIFSVLRVAFSS